MKTLRKLLFMLCVLLGLSAKAQVDNYCLNFTSQEGVVNLGAITSLPADGNYTLQFWFCPTEWQKGAALVRSGEFSIKLGNNHALVVNDGTNHLTLTDTYLGAGKWTHLTLRSDKANEQTEVTLNNSRTYTLPHYLTLPASTSSLWLGGGYNGRLDELRLWKTLLPSDYESFWATTLNKYNPSYSNLVAYWKMDQEQCPNLVDYKAQKFNGTLSSTGVVKEKYADNQNLHYGLSLAYDNIDHFFSKGMDAAFYGTLANRVSLLCAAAYDSGHASLYVQNEQGEVSEGAEYVATQGTSTFTGGTRKGVLHLATEEATFTAPANVLPSTATAFTFEGWVWIEEWKEGALLMEKRQDDTHYLSIRLDTLSAKTGMGRVIASLNGKDVTLTNSKAGRWFYLSFTGEKMGLSSAIGLADAPMVFGQGLKCYLDNIVLRTDTRTSTQMTTDKSSIPFPGPGVSMYNYPYYQMQACYDFDNPEDLGFDRYSMQGYYDNMRKDAGNLRGIKYTVTIHAMSMSDLSGTMANADKRKIMADDLAKIANDPYFDGIDIDYEWLYSEAGWTNIAQMLHLVRQQLKPGKIISVSPHNVTYNYPTSYMSDIDYFNFQQYGPQATHSYYSTFLSYAQAFVNWGFPKDKILLSYSTTSDNGGGAGVIGYNWNANNIPVDNDEFTYNGSTYHMNSLRQVEQRTKYARDGGMGIMYWDMCNDVEPSSSKSFARASNLYMNSNSEALVTEVSTAACAPSEDTAGPVSTADPDDQGGTTEEPVTLQTLEEAESNVKAINITNTNGLGVLYSNAAQTNVWLAESSNASFSDKIDTESEKALWLLITRQGKHYVYNVERQQFLCVPDFNVTSQPCTFTGTPTPLEITCDGQGTFTFRKEGSTEEKGYLCASPQLSSKPVCQWTADDQGSTWSLTTVPIFKADATLAAASAMIDYTSDADAWNNTNAITTLDELDETQAYNLINAKGLGMLYRNTAQTNVWLAESSNSNFSSSINHFTDDALWLLLKDADGKYYLWNIGAEQFVNVPTFNVTSQAVRLQSDPFALELDCNAGAFRMRQYGNTEAKSYLCAAPQNTSMPVAEWTIGDDGCQWRLIAFPGYDASASLTKAKQAISPSTGIEQLPDGQQRMDASTTVYDLAGRRLSRPAQKGIYIVGGRKVVLQ